MLEELNKYRNESGYLNLDMFSNKKGTLSDHYIELISVYKAVRAFIPESIKKKVKSNRNDSKLGIITSIDSIDYYSKCPLSLRPYNPIMESIAATASNYLGGNYILYDVVEKDGLPFGSLSKSFLKEESKFYTLDELIDQTVYKDLSFETVMKVLDTLNIDNKNKIIILNHILETTVIDTFLSQFDRHCANYGFLEHNSEYDIVPNFDCEFWFPNDITDKDINRYSNTRYTRQLMKYYKYFKDNKRLLFSTSIYGYSVDYVVAAIINKKVDVLDRIPICIRELLENFNRTILENLFNFDPSIIVKLLSYEEIKQNEIYKFLLTKSKENFINNLEKSESRIKRL